MTARPYWHWVLVAGLLAWTATTAIQWLLPAPLGHDEAQYALAARDVLDGIEPRWFYLSPGMNALAVPGIILGGSEEAVRLVPFLTGLIFVLAIAGLAWRALGGAAAAWSVAILAGARPLLQRTTELLSDVPSAACMMLAMWVLATELSREQGSRWRLLTVAPLLAAAFYIRYGSCLPVAIICVVPLGLWWRSVFRRPLPVIATALLFGIMLVPHALLAKRTIGSIFGILLLSKEVPGGTFGEGLHTYLTTNPFRFYGALVPLVMVPGLIAPFVVRQRSVIFLWLVGVGDIVGMGLATPAQPRYIFLGTTLLVVLGADLIRRFGEARGSQVRKALAAIALTFLAGSWLVVARQALHYPANTRDKMVNVFKAMEVTKRDAGGKPCQVINKHTTQVEWYGGCVGAWDPPVDAIGRGDAVYAVRDDTGGDQPDLAAMPGKHRVIFESKSLIIVKLEPPL
ncbi:MAG: 4-amino-4-deoxy-L-arabinose transferase [Myxococcales bacterium]|nr:4-amino-4-deoxy-L-arabinose transferase [Myxococcales bacterium]